MHLKNKNVVYRRDSQNKCGKNRPNAVCDCKNKSNSGKLNKTI